MIAASKKLATAYYLMLATIIFLIIPHYCRAYTDHDEDELFYAVSSLRFYLDDFGTAKQGPSIDFNAADLENLWNTVSLKAAAEHRDRLLAARQMVLGVSSQSYREFDDKVKLAKTILLKVWSDLNPYYTKINISRYCFDKQLPYLSNKYRLDKNDIKAIQKYLLPTSHPLKPALDLIFFHKPEALKNQLTFADAEFFTHFAQPTSFIYVASHPLLKGYLVKAYLDDECRSTSATPYWQRLVERCKGAENIRNLITHKKLKHFVVPDKWVYLLPTDGVHAIKQPLLLLVTDMEIVSPEECEFAWKNLATREHIRELYCILSHGFASCFLTANIPFTKHGKFACIDTEHPYRKLKYDMVKRFLSDEMAAYWDALVKSGGKE